MKLHGKILWMPSSRRVVCINCIRPSYDIYYFCYCRRSQESKKGVGCCWQEACLVNKQRHLCFTDIEKPRYVLKMQKWIPPVCCKDIILELGTVILLNAIHFASCCHCYFQKSQWCDIGKFVDLAVTTETLHNSSITCKKIVIFICSVPCIF